MKKLRFLFIAVFLLLAQSLMAAPAEVLFSASHSDRIQLSINGNLVNARPAQNVYIKSRAGLHHIRISVFNRWGRLKFVHHDQVHIRPNRQNHFVLETHPFGGSRLVQLKHEPERKKAPKVHKKRPFRHPAPPTALISDEEFFSLQQALDLRNSDRSRMKTAIRSLRKRSLYAEDVKELMEQFTYEKSRIRFAKYAYPKVVDPARFELVYLALRHESSIYELEAFLNRL